MTNEQLTIIGNAILSAAREHGICDDDGISIAQTAIVRAGIRTVETPAHGPLSEGHVGT
jgi:hypothetical protein